MTRKNKFNAVKTVVDGLTFDSKREAARYSQLRLLEKAGQIRNLRRQIKYPIDVNGHKVCTYWADFCYEELHKTRWVEITEDVKGHRTPIYNLKKRLMRAVWGIDIRET